ncbi:unnamed protein product [Moneuplotes crassus]|uniref:Uncharacterized protein n=1 Tax=Euplotes crassus TaxID=5936 RepID=A0AAD1UKS1_EUPCR|nr:unnamed protein product [Moneuplotes crassus]
MVLCCDSENSLQLFILGLMWTVGIFTMLMPAMEIAGVKYSYDSLRYSMPRETTMCYSDIDFWLQTCKSPGYLPIWQQKDLEKLYIFSNIAMFIIFMFDFSQSKLTSRATKSYLSNFLIFIMFYTSNRDFSQIFLRMFKYGFYWRTDIILLTFLSIKRLLIFISQALMFQRLYDYCFRKWKRCDKLLKVVTALGFLAVDVCLVMVSFRFERVMGWLTGSAWRVGVQNCVWGYLIFSSIYTQRRLGSTTTFSKCCYEIFYCLIFGSDITLGINYVYITESETSTQICSGLFLFSVHLLILLVFIFHQVKCCGPYFPRRLANFRSYIFKLGSEFDSFYLKNRIVPDCSYCMNSIVEPSIL